jgi:hypothetical protein
MEERLAHREGLTLLDGAALVTGAAVASVHIRGVVPEDPVGGGWVLVWGTFAGVALTAAGPFVFLARRFGRKPPGYPRMGDRLWALLGVPWVLTALIQTASATGARRSDLYVGGLGLGLALACMIALAVVWKTWVMVPAETIARAGPTPWTNRVGLVLSVLWPLQCGFGLIVTAQPVGR